MSEREANNTAQSTVEVSWLPLLYAFTLEGKFTLHLFNKMKIFYKCCVTHNVHFRMFILFTKICTEENTIIYKS